MPLTKPPTTDAPVDEFQLMEDALTSDDYELNVSEEDAPETDEPTTEEPDGDAPETDSPVDDDEEDDPVKKELEELRAELAELKKGKEPPTTDAPATQPPPEEQDFLEGEDMEDLMEDPAKLNTLLNKVFQRGVALSSEQLKGLPQQVATQLEEAQKMKALSDKFYTDNEDLKPFKKLVSELYGEKAATDPKLDPEAALSEIAPEARALLGLKAPANPDEPGAENDPPPPPSKKSSRRVRPKPQDPDSFDAELDAMDRALNS